MQEPFINEDFETETAFKIEGSEEVDHILIADVDQSSVDEHKTLDNRWCLGLIDFFNNSLKYACVNRIVEQLVK